MGIIYKITNKVNKKAYIGFTVCSMEERFKHHINDSKRYPKRPLYKAFSKYGIDKFSIEVIEEDIPTHQLKVKEIICIKAFNTYKHGYNATLGGDGRFTIHNKYEIYQWYINNPNQTVRDTALKFIVDYSSVIKILQSFGCEDIRSSRYRATEHNSMPVNMLDKQGNFIKTYPSTMTAFRDVTGFTGSDRRGSHIPMCCAGKRKTAYGYKWEYVS